MWNYSVEGGKGKGGAGETWPGERESGWLASGETGDLSGRCEWGRERANSVGPIRWLRRRGKPTVMVRRIVFSAVKEDCVEGILVRWSEMAEELGVLKEPLCDEAERCLLA